MSVMLLRIHELIHQAAVYVWLIDV